MSEFCCAFLTLTILSQFVIGRFKENLQQNVPFLPLG
jgi:hypothetical protein